MTRLLRRTVLLAPLSLLGEAGGRPAFAHARRQDDAVYVDSLLGASTTRRGGLWPLTARPATMNGDTFAHAIVTEVGSAQPIEQTSTLRLHLGGAYGRFVATVGRDDNETGGGPAYVYFELWGDDALLFRSTPIRSHNFLVRARPGANTRKAPQAVDVSVRGVQSLRLIVRYAADIDQEGPQIVRGRGCVWGDARLLPATGGDTAPAPTVNIGNLRDAVRGAAAQMAAQAASDLIADNKTTLPVKLFIAPPPDDSPAPVRSAALREMLATFLLAARRPGSSGSGAVFALPTRPRRAGSVGSTLDEARAAARRSGADAVLRPSLLPPTETERGWRLEMRLYVVETGAEKTVVIAPLSPRGDK